MVIFQMLGYQMSSHCNRTEKNTCILATGIHSQAQAINLTKFLTNIQFYKHVDIDRMI